MRRALMLAMVLATAATLGAGAKANPVKSLYTTIDLSECKQVKRHRDGNAWTCEGLPGFPVYIAEGDLRHFVSVGANPDKRRAATQTLGSFNSIFEQGSHRATIEWRFDRKGDREVPYAAIIRFHTSNDAGRGDVLVVFKVMEYDTCHIAYIDALANDEPVALARRIADRESHSFNCPRMPPAEGARGKSPM
jgi:hypothetical protein